MNPEQERQQQVEGRVETETKYIVMAAAAVALMGTIYGVLKTKNWFEVRFKQITTPKAHAGDFNISEIYVPDRVMRHEDPQNPAA